MGALGMTRVVHGGQSQRAGEEGLTKLSNSVKSSLIRQAEDCELKESLKVAVGSSIQLQFGSFMFRILTTGATGE